MDGFYLVGKVTGRAFKKNRGFSESEAFQYPKSVPEAFDLHFSISVVNLLKSRDANKTPVTPSFEVGLGPFLIHSKRQSVLFEILLEPSHSESAWAPESGVRFNVPEYF